MRVSFQNIKQEIERALLGKQMKSRVPSVAARKAEELLLLFEGRGDGARIRSCVRAEANLKPSKPKHKSVLRSARMMVRFTTDEKREIDTEAAELGLSSASFVRSLVIQHLRKGLKKKKARRHMSTSNGGML